MTLEDAISYINDKAKGQAEQFDVLASRSHSEGKHVELFRLALGLVVDVRNGVFESHSFGSY